jgi:hypothetical protein
MARFVVEIKRGFVEAVWSDAPAETELIVVDWDARHIYEGAGEDASARVDVYEARPLSHAESAIRVLATAGYESADGYAALMADGRIVTSL